MFDDDIALLSSIPVGLQNQMNVLCEVANTLGLLINLEKTKIVVFRNRGCLARAERWYYGSEPVSVASSYKYLGLKFTTKACLNRISKDCLEGKRDNRIDCFKCCRILDALTSVFFKLFDTQIVPVLLYGSELSGYSDCPNVEKVHMYACERILGLSSHMVNGELGKHHLQDV